MRGRPVTGRPRRAAGVELGGHVDALRAGRPTRPGPGSPAPRRTACPGSVRATMRTENVSTSIRLHAHHASARPASSCAASRRRRPPRRPAADLGGPADVDRRRDRHVDDGPRPVPGQVGDLGDLAVRGDDDLAAHRADAGDPEGDLLDRPTAGSDTPLTEMRTTSPKPYCRSPVMKKPAPMSWTNRCRPNPSAALSSAAGATRPGQRHAEALHDEHGGDHVDHGEGAPGQHLRHDMPVLGGLGAHQLLVNGDAGVDALHDLAARPIPRAG